MKKILITAITALAFATMSHAFEYGYEADASWERNSYQSTDLANFNGFMNFFSDGTTGTGQNPPGGFTQGVGQIFAVTNTFTVEKIRLWSARYYTTNSLTMTLYKDVDVRSGAPEDYMIPENLVVQYEIAPTNVLHGSSGDAPGDIFTISLATNEYFELSPPQYENYNYYFHVGLTEPIDPGTNTATKVMIWNFGGDYDTEGYYVTPEGTQGAVGRDLGLAFLSTNPPVVIEPEIPEGWLVPVADTSLRFGTNQENNYGTSATLDTRQNDTAPRDFFSYIRFDLSNLAGTISNATLEVTQNGGDTLVNGRVRFMGLQNVASNTPQNWVETDLTCNTLGAEFLSTNYYPSPIVGSSPFDFENNRVIDFEENIPGIIEGASGGVASISGQPLIDWLEERRADDGFVTFIIDFPAGASDKAVYYNSRESAGVVPFLKLEGVSVEILPPQFDPVITSIAYDAGTVTIDWDSDVNGIYEIQSKDTLSIGNWAPIPSATNLTGGLSNSTSFSASGDVEFYRIYGE